MKKIITLLALIALTYNLNAQINISAGNSSTSICAGYCGGFLHPVVTGGTAPYAYSWSTGETTSNLDSVCAGTYTLTVTDNLGAVANATFAITQNDPIIISATAVNTVTCYGVEDGSVSVMVSGGNPPYEYYINNTLNSTGIFNNLAAGNHSIYVNDANNCSGYTNITITQPPYLASNLSSFTSSDPGACNGSATITTNGGAAPYAYNWSNGETTATASNLCNQTYTVTVVDANGCTSLLNTSDSLNLSDSTICHANFTWQYNPENNNIQFTDLSSTSTSWTWMFNGQTTTTSTLQNPILNLNDTVVYYQVCLIINNSSFNCSDTICKIINLNDSTPCSNLFIQYDAIINEGTNSGSNDGSIQITVFGGFAPYSYLWNNGATNEDIYNISEGYYNIQVTDANGCYTNSTVYINNINNYIINDTIYNTPVDTCFSFPVVDAYVYSYDMTDSTIVSVVWAYVDASGNVAFLTEEYGIDTEGNYMVTSSINCNTGTKAAIIFTGIIHVDFEEMLGIEKPQIFNSINLYPNPITDQLNIQLNLTENSNITISIINAIGQVIIQKSENLSSGFQELKININEIKSGLYLINLNDNKGNYITKKLVK